MTPPARYPVPARELRREDVIQRSRFLTTLAPTSSIEEAEALVARCRAEFPEASHHCWAYLIGPPGSTAQVGMSDDGEPHGTAGRPMLNALVHSGLGDVAAVVTRWFGGTKLGKGGLVRAYGGGVVQALAEVERGEKIDWTHLRLSADYGHQAALIRLYPAHEAEVLEEVFAADVTHAIRVPAEREDGLRRAVDDLTAGRATFA